MAEFKKNNRFSGSSRPSFGGNKGGNFRSNSFGGGRPEQKELFDAECNSCHKRCQVPFRPNGKKPVYCADCFTKDDDRGRSTYAPKSYGARDYSSSPRTTSAPAPQNDRQIQELSKKIEMMSASIEKLAASFEGYTRSQALTKEVRKHVPAAKPASAPAKAAVPAKKVTKKVTKVAKKK